jgi:hypothetical protein
VRVPAYTCCRTGDCWLPSHHTAAVLCRQVIMKTRPPCWQQIAMRIQAAEFEPLSKDLNIPPFADLRQAVLYVPWALLQKDDISGAGDTRKAYRDFEQHVKVGGCLRVRVVSAIGPALIHSITCSWVHTMSHLQDLQLAAESAAAGDGDPVRVQQAFLLMSASLDRWVGALIPQHAHQTSPPPEQTHLPYLAPPAASWQQYLPPF